MSGPSSDPTISTSTSAGTGGITMISVSITGCFRATDGTYTGSITIDAGAAGRTLVPVTLYVR